MKILSVDANDVQIGRVQLRRPSGAIEIALPLDGAISDVTDAEFLKSDEMDAMKELGYQEGLKRAEEELQIALNELRAKHEENMALLLKQHQSAISSINAIAESLNDTVEQFKSRTYEVCLALCYEAIVKVLGKSSEDKTLIASICNSVYEDYSGMDCTIGLSREDLALVEPFKLPLKMKIVPELRPGQCRVMHASGFDDTGIDVRLGLIKDSFLKSLLAGGR